MVDFLPELAEFSLCSAQAAGIAELSGPVLDGLPFPGLALECGDLLADLLLAGHTIPLSMARAGPARAGPGVPCLQSRVVDCGSPYRSAQVINPDGDDRFSTSKGTPKHHASMKDIRYLLHYL